MDSYRKAACWAGPCLSPFLMSNLKLESKFHWASVSHQNFVLLAWIFISADYEIYINDIQSLQLQSLLIPWYLLVLGNCLDEVFLRQVCALPLDLIYCILLFRVEWDKTVLPVQLCATQFSVTSGGNSSYKAFHRDCYVNEIQSCFFSKRHEFKKNPISSYRKIAS